jgi:hypothetical protein
MELFMVHTGFYDIVTKKAGERQAEIAADEQRMMKRMQSLGVNLGVEEAQRKLSQK